MTWQAAFHEPVLTPDGEMLRTLDDARAYILTLPETVVRTDRWQTAVEAMLLVAHDNGPSDFARIGLMQALYWGTMRKEAAELSCEFRTTRPMS